MQRAQTPLEKAFVEYVASIRPDQNKHVAAEVGKVQGDIAAAGVWSEMDEWRISTWFDVRIERTEVDEKPWFRTRVACDGQEFTCLCPNPEKAFLLSKFYRRIIMSQFYSVGPPWAGEH